MLAPQGYYYLWPWIVSLVWALLSALVWVDLVSPASPQRMTANLMKLRTMYRILQNQNCSLMMLWHTGTRLQNMHLGVQVPMATLLWQLVGALLFEFLLPCLLLLVATVLLHQGCPLKNATLQLELRNWMQHLAMGFQLDRDQVYVFVVRCANDCFWQQKSGGWDQRHQTSNTLLHHLSLRQMFRRNRKASYQKLSVRTLLA